MLGHGVRDLNDRYGYAYKDVPQRGFQTALELPMLEHGDGGTLRFIGLTERLVNAADKCTPFLSDTTQAIKVSNRDMFMEDRVLFYNDTIGGIEGLRDMESDFGMIPQPKLDETQENYHVQMGTGSGMYFIPKTVKNVKMTVDVLNAINCISHVEVVPEYYGVSLKEKYTRSAENVEVIDIINSAIMMDCSFAFASTITNELVVMFYKVTTKAQPAASLFETCKPLIEKNSQKLYDAFAALE